MKGIRTVIVEDDPMVMQVNRQYIEEIGGFEIVGTAETGYEALSVIRKIQPDVVILDIYLPDLDGIQTLKELRSDNIPTDVILVTAARDVETIQNAFRYGATDYIIKPFKFSRLKSALESYKLLHSKLHRKTSLDQDEIDDLTMNKTRMQETLPKGLNEVTLRQVLLFLLKRKDPLSAEEVAEGVGLARVTARRYLDYLEKTGKLAIEAQYGSVGRPVNRYRVV
ncbi:response regulator [Dethiobacter alkaliphilus]|uniref:Transcriptional regulatory protein n=1 Tax=Dethiobacter alkaliphilus AHT 1 TaxID=555088 RepID=C0GIJ8_DETAL|nr:response regulator [Dethiobacter alkaliphilus]EEG76859.1 response regulator receiver [Dethiobacter alkaliphilus AHT 1]